MIVRTIAAATMTLLCAGGAWAQGAAVGGSYQVQGKNIDGRPYTGTAEIIVTSRTTCRIVWKTGGTTSQGICMRSGSVFTAAYGLQGKVGLVIYDMQPDGRMVGSWTIADTPGAGEEILVPMR